MIAVELLSGDMSIGAEGTVTAHRRQIASTPSGTSSCRCGNTELPFARAEVLALLPESLFVVQNFFAARMDGHHHAGPQHQHLRRAGPQGRHRPVRHHGEGWTPRAARVSHADDPGSRALALHRADRRVFGHGRHRAHARPSQLLAARRRGVRQRRSAAEARQHLRGRLQRAAASLHRRRLAAGLDAGRAASTRSRSRASISKSTRPSASAFCRWIKSPLRRGRCIRAISVELAVTFTGENGLEMQKSVRYRVPVGAPLGLLNFTVSDGSLSNALDYQQLSAEPPQKPRRSWSRS